ncbi:hypothetical protein [Salipiger thiooxidans]|uniref:hypothetical protein n=1 Tax=Salipiger thiooxidans TaxID=282683 RepID=UPI001CD48EAD|nr:hypothetical protein [Salipiger thiooxidans]MCA0850700.1 hypothetical protein [Salipiger thiooxidans]
MIRATTLRIPTYSGVLLRGQAVAAGTTTEGWRDKKAHGARRSGGCFCRDFWPVSHRAALARTVRFAAISLIFFSVLHCAGLIYGR